ncbi:SDR family oxidoreductase [Flavobacterium sp.]|uniref:SDR family oxidoreductase n=1 Tax=Flavobacterium sp. TaxID=239 RepID=UPI00261DE9A5|nr:SDR family oxidoreductase [Flavobacterium sp.]
MKNILVTNGNIGTAVAILLAKQGHKVSIMVRKPQQNDALAQLGISFVVADAAKPDSLPDAFKNIDAFLFVSPLIENMVEQATVIINAAKRAGVKQLVRSSANGASPDAPIVMGKLHGKVQELVKECGIPYAIIQPASFFQNIFGSLSTIKAQQAFYGSAGEGKNGLVDVRDIAAVAATIINEGSVHNGKTYVVTGPRAISNRDMATVLSNKLGVDIKYIDLSPEDLGNAYKEYGMNDFTINAVLELDNITKLGYVANISNDVAEVTGIQPINFEQFVTEHIQIFK